MNTAIRILMAFAALTLAACEDSPGGSTATDGGTRAERPSLGDPLAIRPLTVKGSDTIVIVSTRLAEKFMTAHDMTRVNVTGGGSVLGINALLDGSADIADVSRPLQEQEKADLQAKWGKAAVQTKIGLDGLAVFANRSNTVQFLTLAQLKDMYTGKVKNWKQVGGSDLPVVLYGRDNKSGTYGYFKEHVLQGADFAPDVKEMLTSPEVAAVANDKGAIGYGGIAYESRIRAIPIKTEASSPAVEPRMETIVDGTYPISRGLYLVTVGEPAGLAKDFIAFALSPEGQKTVSEVGYYSLPASPQPQPTGVSNPSR